MDQAACSIDNGPVPMCSIRSEVFSERIRFPSESATARQRCEGKLGETESAVSGLVHILNP